MKLEYLPTGAPECPLLRLYDFDSDTVKHFRGLCTELATEGCDCVQMPEDLQVEAIADCRLVLKRVRSRFGLRQVTPQVFECALGREDWDNIAALLEPFCESDLTGFQWLVDKGEIRLLFSCDGKW